MKAAFLFAGQGAQTVGMGKDLVERSAAAAAVFQEADRVLDWSVSEVCFNGPAEKLTESKYCQPSIYTTSVACLAAFQEKYPEVKPVAAGGLSLGEYGALFCGDYFSFADGLRLVAKRAELMDQACRETEGGMASILGCDPAAIAEVCRECDIDVANYNCPGQIVISGVRERVEKAAELLKNKGARRVVPLKVAGAFHSRLMATAGAALGEVLAKVPTRPLQVPVAQNFVGTFVSDEARIKENLVKQVAGSVRWDSCVLEMIAKYGADTMIEFGPGAVLTGLVRKIDSTVKTAHVSTVADLDGMEF